MELNPTSLPSDVPAIPPEQRDPERQAYIRRCEAALDDYINSFRHTVGLLVIPLLGVDPMTLPKDGIIMRWNAATGQNPELKSQYPRFIETISQLYSRQDQIFNVYRAVVRAISNREQLSDDVWHNLQALYRSYSRMVHTRPEFDAGAYVDIARAALTLGDIEMSSYILLKSLLHHSPLAGLSSFADIVDRQSVDQVLMAQQQAKRQ